MLVPATHTDPRQNREYMKYLKRILTTLVLSTFSLGIISTSDPMNTEFEPVEPALQYSAKSIIPHEIPDTISVMTWNVKFGGARLDFFIDCYDERVHLTSEELNSNLSNIAEKIRQADPDILLLQEMDIDSKRCAYLDMVQVVLDCTDLNYGVYGSQWKADLVPSRTLGRVNSGNATLSKWPLKNPTRYALPLREDQDPVTRYFYLKRNILIADVELGERSLTVLNTHLAAFAPAITREKQLKIVTDLVDSLRESNTPFLIGGDFNVIPPMATKRHNFEDILCGGDFDAGDFRQYERAMEPFYNKLTPAVTEAQLQNFEKLHFTHSAHRDFFWNRKVDYLFMSEGIKVDGSGSTHQCTASGGMETMSLSDHAPISAKITFSSNLEQGSVELL